MPAHILDSVLVGHVLHAHAEQASQDARNTVALPAGCSALQGDD